MKRILSTSAVLALAGLLAACGGPKLNGKTQETLQLSMKEVIESLDTKEARQFQQDMFTISLTVMADMKLDIKAIEAMSNELLDTLDGKTAADVHEYAEELRKKAEAKKVADAEARKNRGPVLDGQSERTLNKSLREMGRGLSEDERKELQASVEVIAKDIFNRHKGVMFAKEESIREFLRMLNDKSFKEVTALADEVRAKQG
jgi:hypothetical protein